MQFIESYLELSRFPVLPWMTVSRYGGLVLLESFMYLLNECLGFVNKVWI